MRSLYLKLYADLVRRLRLFGHHELPLTGVLQLPEAASVLEPAQRLKQAFATGTAGDVQAGFLALRSLSKQLQFLLQAEEHTRQALASWRQLQLQQQARQRQLSEQLQPPMQRHQQHEQQDQAQQQRAGSPGDAYSCSLRDAALLLHRLHHQDSLLLEEEEQRAVAEPAVLQQRVEAELQQLAQLVAAGGAADAAGADAAAAAGGAGAGAGAQGADAAASAGAAGAGAAAGAQGASAAAAAAAAGQVPQQQQLEAASEAFFRRMRFRADALEWVYDGMAPALLPDVLRGRRGTPLLLALAFCLVGRRLGLPLALQQASHEQLPTGEGPLHLADMPAEVAARQAGRTVAAAPAGPAWLVRLVQPGGELLFVDVARRGEVVGWQQAAERYPGLARELPGAEAQVLALWRGLARTMVLGHQRRGESDAVGHWLYQLLALEPAAPEWQLLLGGGGGGGGAGQRGAV